jgi:hypothetical protein
MRHYYPLSGPSVRYSAVMSTISMLPIREGDNNDSQNMRFSRGRGTKRTEADHHPEHTKISSVSLTI